MRAMLALPRTLSSGIVDRPDDLLTGAHAANLSGAPFDGVTVAAGANAGSGMSAALAPAFIGEGARVPFTGHLSAGAPSEAWVRFGAAHWRRWNVHPDAALTPDLLAARPRIAMTAFVDAAGRAALAVTFPKARFADEPVMEW